MALADVVEATRLDRGIKCYTLGGLRDEYLKSHPELQRERGSKFLYQDVRRELGDLGARMWPETLKSNEQEVKVYVIIRSSKVGSVLSLLLSTEPNETAAAALGDCLDSPPLAQPASG